MEGTEDARKVCGASGNPALVYLTDRVRVIECRDRLQWILQCRRSVCPNSWRGVAFCRTRESLLRCAGQKRKLANLWPRRLLRRRTMSGGRQLQNPGSWR
jgi:hypothetical protein